jgi:CheY-like chemotaxis protein
MKRFRARGGEIGIAISGFSQDEDLAASRRAGFAEHLVKPIDVTTLVEAVERARWMAGPTAG